MSWPVVAAAQLEVILLLLLSQVAASAVNTAAFTAFAAISAVVGVCQGLRTNGYLISFYGTHFAHYGSESSTFISRPMLMHSRLMSWVLVWDSQAALTR